MGSTAKAALYLTSGRTIGFVLLFVVPLVLSRHLTQHEFGIYKYLFLLSGTLGVLQFGMAESLYFFIPRTGPRAGRAVMNAVLMLTAIACGSLLLVNLVAPAIAAKTSHQEIIPYLPVFGVFLALMLVSAPLEIIMVSRQQHRRAAVTYAASDGLRAVALLVPGVLFQNAGAVMAGAAVIGVVRCLTLAAYIRREFHGDLRPDGAIWRQQLAYALPFTAAVVLEVVQMNLHQYAVEAKFSMAEFAVYAVGCMQIPLVDLLAQSTANVMMVRMSEQLAAGHRVVGFWLDAVERLAFVFVPLVVALLLTGHDLISVLYPPEYRAAVPVFLLSTGLIALASFPVDGVLRVFAQTRFLILMNVIRLAIVVGGVRWALNTYGLKGAIGITVVAQVVAKAVAVMRIGQITGTAWGHVLPWRALGQIAGAALVAAVPAAWVHRELHLPPLWLGASTTVVYGAAYLIAMTRLRASWRAHVARHLGWQSPGIR